MRVLIAHPEAATRRVIGRLAGLVDGAMEPVECGEGQDALELLLAEDAPEIAVVDGGLSGLDAFELCRLACQFHEGAPPYIILLAAAPEDVVAGLDAGASDCVRAPVDGAELRARLEVGRRTAALLARRAAPDVHDGAVLVAQRSQDDDKDDPPPDGKFELRSVLVAE